MQFNFRLERQFAEPEPERERVVVIFAVILHENRSVSAEGQAVAVRQPQFGFDDVPFLEQRRFLKLPGEQDGLRFAAGSPAGEGNGIRSRNGNLQILKGHLDLRRRERFDLKPEPFVAERREHRPALSGGGGVIDRRNQRNGAAVGPSGFRRSEVPALPVAVDRQDPEFQPGPVERPGVIEFERLRQSGSGGGRNQQHGNRKVKEKLFHGAASFPHQNGVLRSPGISPRETAAACPSRNSTCAGPLGPWTKMKPRLLSLMWLLYQLLQPTSLKTPSEARQSFDGYLNWFTLANWVWYHATRSFIP
ncbi:hypothetical protein SDC9_133312 [bioreactor metagenome]|uniref:Uncharacterized protein n=1 Tax=bioreactor metagenome TaxID=1076179 RepID=A0A645DA53_9ZZZZ